MENSFYGLGIAPKLLEVLDQANFKIPTPIQQKAIPVALEGKDLIGIAQTGTGKTLAFGVPVIQRIMATKHRALILLPTRELALQVNETLQQIGRSFGIRTTVLIGGTAMNPQIQALRNNPNIIIATPGRAIDHLQQRTLNLQDIHILVLDEADRMLDMGFAPQIKRILAVVPRDRQTLLFSATMPDDIVRIAAQHMQLPMRVEIAKSGTTAERVEQELFVVHKNDKIRLLDKLLSEYHGTVLVFSRTKHGAKKIRRAVHEMGHRAAEIHANRSLAQRREALEGFKSGKYRVLVATDIASRGIDVTDIELVVNFDVPENPEDYVHRIGRTGRAGRAGRAITFAMPDQHGEVRDIERLVRTALRVSELPELPPERPRRPEPQEGHRRFSQHARRPHYRGGQYDRSPRHGAGTESPQSRRMGASEQSPHAPRTSPHRRNRRRFSPHRSFR